MKVFFVIFVVAFLALYFQPTFSAKVSVDSFSANPNEFEWFLFGTITRDNENDISFSSQDRFYLTTADDYNDSNLPDLASLFIKFFNTQTGQSFGNATLPFEDNANIPSTQIPLTDDIELAQSISFTATIRFATNKVLVSPSSNATFTYEFGGIDDTNHAITSPLFPLTVHHSLARSISFNGTCTQPASQCVESSYHVTFLNMSQTFTDVTFTVRGASSFVSTNSSSSSSSLICYLNNHPIVPIITQYGQNDLYTLIGNFHQGYDYVITCPQSVLINHYSQQNDSILLVVGTPYEAPPVELTTNSIVPLDLINNDQQIVNEIVVDDNNNNIVDDSIAPSSLSSSQPLSLSRMTQQLEYLSTVGDATATTTTATEIPYAATHFYTTGDLVNVVSQAHPFHLQYDVSNLQMLSSGYPISEGTHIFASRFPVTLNPLSSEQTLGNVSASFGFLGITPDFIEAIVLNDHTILEHHTLAYKYGTYSTFKLDFKQFQSLTFIVIAHVIDGHRSTISLRSVQTTLQLSYNSIPTSDTITKPLISMSIADNTVKPKLSRRLYVDSTPTRRKNVTIAFHMDSFTQYDTLIDFVVSLPAQHVQLTSNRPGSSLVSCSIGSYILPDLDISKQESKYLSQMRFTNITIPTTASPANVFSCRDAILYLPPHIEDFERSEPLNVFIVEKATNTITIAHNYQIDPNARSGNLFVLAGCIVCFIVFSMLIVSIFNCIRWCIHRTKQQQQPDNQESLINFDNQYEQLI